MNFQTESFPSFLQKKTDSPGLHSFVTLLSIMPDIMKASDTE